MEQQNATSKAYPCVACGTSVGWSQGAVECDSCGQWQHLKCETGITWKQYRNAVKKSKGIPFTCRQCEQKTVSGASCLLRGMSILIQYKIEAWHWTNVWAGWLTLQTLTLYLPISISYALSPHGNSLRGGCLDWNVSRFPCSDTSTKCTQSLVCQLFFHSCCMLRLTD